MHTAGQIHDDTKNMLRTFWSWLRRTGADEGAVAAKAPAIAATAAPEQSARQPGIVLPFPVRGEALLVKLAELLRRRVAEIDAQPDRLTLTLSHSPHLRLSLDDDAYIEFDADTSEYELVIETSGSTRLIIQTVEFDNLVTFVLQYVIERISDDRARFEVAS